MTKVVFQGQGYWLLAEFWEEAADAGLEPILVERRNGVFASRTITPDEFIARSSERVAG